MSKVKLDWDDISLVPSLMSEIDSRSDINPYYKNNKLPIFTAPMDKVVSKDNAKLFLDNNINVCLPRNIKDVNDECFYSYGLDEIVSIVDNKQELPKNVLIDIANGHMKKLYDVVKKIKKTYDIELMIGNIANPETYRLYCDLSCGVDYIRVGIGGGSVCTTSANVSVHYPMASLVNECYRISMRYKNPPKIVADGGFKNFSDINKAIALGADYVMLGSIFNKCIESCSESYIKQGDDYKLISDDDAIEYFEADGDVYKYFRGMSTKEVQKSWNKLNIKTGEGISLYNKVEYNLSGWCENFTDYLKSSMSYTGFCDINNFRGNADWIQISNMAFNRFNK